MIDRQNHPAADSFPMMDDGRYADLLLDIQVRGQIEPITLCDGMILDGRNRYRACVELGIEPKTRVFDGDDPWLYVWSLNGERRDLAAEQRYLIWKHCHEHSETFQAERRRIAEEANRKRSEAMQGVPYAPKGEPRKAEEKVAGHCDPPPSMDRHPERATKANASNTNIGAVKRGDELAKARPDLAEQVRTGAMKPAQAHREMKREELADRANDLPDGVYRVVYADPPWQYNDKCDSGSIQSGGAEKHYPSMSMAELRALDVQGMVDDNAVLFLWATCPLLEDALDLARAWGFRYKAQFVWDKVKHNMGHYNSVRHELLLICTRGSCTPDNVQLFDSVQSIERTEHSRKPEAFREIIDTIYPVGPRIELFRRGEAPANWVVWGNEIVD